MGYSYNTVPPEGVPLALIQWIERELLAISEAFEELDNVRLKELHVEPERPRDGNIVLADGTDWDPGSGAGFYGYQGGSWTFLG